MEGGGERGGRRSGGEKMKGDGRRGGRAGRERQGREGGREGGKDMGSAQLTQCMESPVELQDARDRKNWYQCMGIKDCTHTIHTILGFINI